jgi:hypothetical protein
LSEFLDRKVRAFALQFGSHLGLPVHSASLTNIPVDAPLRLGFRS